MSAGMRLRAVVVFAFALLFYSGFMFAKHDPALTNVIPFGEDPYDAVGSFGAILAMLLSVLSLVRAFRAGRDDGAGPARALYLRRTQSAVVLCAAITVLGDAVAMAREPSRWIGAPSRLELVALLVALLLAAWVVQYTIGAGPQPATPASRGRWRRALLPLIAFVLVLAIYPARLVRFTATHLLTVVIGAVLLVAPMPPILLALVPGGAGEAAGGGASDGPARRGARGRWWVVAAIGIAVGVFAFAGEMTEGGGGTPAIRLAAVAAVFIGLATSGTLIAFAFLRRPLGLGTRAGRS